MTELFENHQLSPDMQYTKLAAVSASSDPLARPARVLRVYVPAGGDAALTVRAVNDSSTFVLRFPAGLWYEPGIFSHVTAIDASSGVEVHAGS